MKTNSKTIKMSKEYRLNLAGGGSDSASSLYDSAEMLRIFKAVVIWEGGKQTLRLRLFQMKVI